jgi:hypothetical protein
MRIQRFLTAHGSGQRPGDYNGGNERYDRSDAHEEIAAGSEALSQENQPDRNRSYDQDAGREPQKFVGCWPTVAHCHFSSMGSATVLFEREGLALPVRIEHLLGPLGNFVILARRIALSN